MLKTIRLERTIRENKKKLEALRAKDAEMATREAALKAAFEEVTEDTAAEDRAAIEAEMDEYDEQKAAHDSEKKRLQDEIEQAEAELAALEEKQKDTPPEEPAPEEARNAKGERKAMSYASRRAFGERTAAEIKEIIENKETANWVANMRSAIKEKRTIENVGLTIPTVVLPLIREKIERTSKLYSRVALRRVNGEGEQNISNGSSEGVWTQCCAKLNELEMGFSRWSYGCFKVGGYYTVCNANIEDSDLDIAAEAINAIGAAIARALDKAIVWGRNIAANSKMPQGIVPSLAQTSQPADYPVTARPWVDLHTSNIISIGTAQNPVTGAALFAAINEAAGVADTDYTDSDLTWMMNRKTWRKLTSQAVTFNAAGAIVAGVNKSMPVAGGEIINFKFLPDDVIVFGYTDVYGLTERKGPKTATSEHVRFLEDETVYKGTARYDGAPLVREAFGVILLNGATLDLTDVTFPQDTANA